MIELISMYWELLPRPLGYFSVRMQLGSVVHLEFSERHSENTRSCIETRMEKIAVYCCIFLKTGNQYYAHGFLSAW